nr:hypothetical protein [Tanacetum cinerariifolium]
MANKVKSSKLRRLRKVGASRRVESSDDIEDVFNQGRMIDDLDKDEGIELVKDDADIAESEGRHAAEQAENQLLELMLSKSSRKNTKCVNAANEELTAAKHKLMMLKLKLFKNIAAAEEITK